ncbi:hypothetical protein GALMADRAFT_159034 [Galerina marginata CBS 339.88]|uniref:Uncharacterized protein n=1 Tax=Galerina marginata (strain CBS 339.88) TaxID=685588 RepID=A0A067SN43_GALM3|nr:hypothetical protein GALMADRAFT_159034 [Galerina marginata CBS 339.88]
MTAQERDQHLPKGSVLFFCVFLFLSLFFFIQQPRRQHRRARSHSAVPLPNAAGITKILAPHGLARNHCTQESASRWSRGPINLPPPASLGVPPRTSSALSSYPSSPLLTTNTQKDLHLSLSSPRMAAASGVVLVLMVGSCLRVPMLVPDITTIVRGGLQENMNFALNGGTPALRSGTGADKGGLSGFHRFAYPYPFTMKTLDVIFDCLAAALCCISRHKRIKSEFILKVD